MTGWDKATPAQIRADLVAARDALYLCERRKPADSEYDHVCDLLPDHLGKHACICGATWADA